MLELVITFYFIHGSKTHHVYARNLQDLADLTAGLIEKYPTAYVLNRIDVPGSD